MARNWLLVSTSLGLLSVACTAPERTHLSTNELESDANHLQVDDGKARFARVALVRGIEWRNTGSAGHIRLHVTLPAGDRFTKYHIDFDVEKSDCLNTLALRTKLGWNDASMGRTSLSQENCIWLLYNNAGVVKIEMEIDDKGTLEELTEKKETAHTKLGTRAKLNNLSMFRPKP